MKNMHKKLVFFKDAYSILSDLKKLRKNRQPEETISSRNAIFSLSDNFSKIMEKSQQDGISKSLVVSIVATIITDKLTLFLT